MISCDFCIEGESGKINPAYVCTLGRTSRILSSWRSFYLVPTISPIVKNHVLLIPRRHINARIHLSSDESAELAIIEREVAARLVQSRSSVLFFEHGIGKGASGGCGISHCHIHVMPLDQDKATSFIQRLRELESGILGEHLSAISVKQSYIYVRLESDAPTMTIVREGNFPSQFLRNLLEDTIGVPRSNWRDISQTQIFLETLASAEWL